MTSSVSASNPVSPLQKRGERNSAARRANVRKEIASPRRCSPLSPRGEAIDGSPAIWPSAKTTWPISLSLVIFMDLDRSEFRPTRRKTICRISQQSCFMPPRASCSLPRPTRYASHCVTQHKPRASCRLCDLCRDSTRHILPCTRGSVGTFTAFCRCSKRSLGRMRLFAVLGMENYSFRGHTFLPFGPKTILNETDCRRRPSNKSSRSKNGSLCLRVVSSVCAPGGGIFNRSNAGSGYRAELNRLCRKWLSCPAERAAYLHSCSPVWSGSGSCRNIFSRQSSRDWPAALLWEPETNSIHIRPSRTDPAGGLRQYFAPSRKRPRRGFVFCRQFLRVSFRRQPEPTPRALSLRHCCKS